MWRENAYTSSVFLGESIKLNYIYSKPLNGFDFITSGINYMLLSELAYILNESVFTMLYFY